MSEVSRTLQGLVKFVDDHSGPVHGFQDGFLVASLPRPRCQPSVRARTIPERGFDDLGVPLGSQQVKRGDHHVRRAQTVHPESERP